MASTASPPDARSRLPSPTPFSPTWRVTGSLLFTFSFLSFYFIDDGTVAESGRHEELLRKSGRYASFYRLQLRDQQPAPRVAIVSSA